MLLFFDQLDKECIEKACKVIERYDSKGLVLRYASVDSYVVLAVVLTLEFMSKGVLNKLSNTCRNALINVLRRSVDNMLLDEVDRCIIDLILRLASGSRINLESYGCRLLNDWEEAFLELAKGVIALKLRIMYDYSRILSKAKSLRNYIEYLTSREGVDEFGKLAIPSAIKLYIVINGLDIIKQLAEKYRDIQKQVMGATKLALILLCIFGPISLLHLISPYMSIPFFIAPTIYEIMITKVVEKYFKSTIPSISDKVSKFVAFLYILYISRKHKSRH